MPASARDKMFGVRVLGRSAAGVHSRVMPNLPPEATTLSLERYAADAKALVAAAQSLADERKHAEVQPLHLLVRALGRDLGVRAVFERGVSNLLEFEAALERALGSLPRSAEPAYLSAAMLDLLERAQREADREKSEKVTVEHVVNALSQEIRGVAGEILSAFGVLPGSKIGRASCRERVCHNV